MSSSWYGKMKTSQQSRPQPLPKEDETDVVKGPKPHESKYQVGMRVNDRRKGVALKQEYGEVKAIEGNQMKIVWFDKNDKKQKEEFFDIVEVLPGELPETCGWEFFRAVRQPSLEGDERPRQLWKVTALAKISPNPSEPTCLTLGRPASLVKLVLSSEGRQEIPDHFGSVFFYWEDCRDNVLSDASGDRLLISADVIDPVKMQRPVKGTDFPTRLGTPPGCVDENNPRRPTRQVEFHTGGVEFKLDLGLEPSTIVDTSSDSI